MNRFFTIWMMFVASVTTLFATEKGELRMYVFQNGDEGETFHVVREIDSIKFAYDTTRSGMYVCVFKGYDGTVLEETKNTYDYVTAHRPTRDEDLYYGYIFKGWQRDESKIMSDTLIYTAMYDSVSNVKQNGALISAPYKVSATKSVYFSQGNLQFNAKQGTHAVLGGTTEVAGTWRFAEKQYDYIGEVNSNISSSYDGWIDLFGWGTSGWNSDATAYQPWATSDRNYAYYPGGSKSNNLTGDFAKADWGVYNAISNGYNIPNKWRVLTIEEWQYLYLNTRWTPGYINISEDKSVLCLFLFPEDFVFPSGIDMMVLSTQQTLTKVWMSYKEDSYASNIISIDQFKELERLGVVALPATGVREATELLQVGKFGEYWSSSIKESGDVYGFGFWFDSLYADDPCNRFIGASVRLVRDVK